MIFGIVSLNSDVPIRENLIAEMREIFSLSSSLPVEEVIRTNAFFLRASTGALNSYSGIFNDGSSCVSLIAGEPLLTNRGIEKDHISLSRAIESKNFNTLRSLRGVFCLLRYFEKDEPVLEICSDKLGIRPLYYWTDGQFVVVSTLLKILEIFSLVPVNKDEIALSEIVGFGFPLGNRTKYENIKLLRESNIIRFTRGHVESSTYWRWDKIEQQDITKEVATAEAYRIFKEAISLRLREDSTALAFLSGGMDSRAIVGAMVDLGIQTQLFNFSPTASQDQDFATQFADKIGHQLSLIPRNQDYSIGFRCKLASLTKELIEQKKMVAKRPRAVWSGDGGSVSLGCVYLDDEIVEMMRGKNLLGTVQLFRKKNKNFLPLRAMKRAYVSKMSEFLDDRIVGEIDRLESSDPGQALFLFLMLNDQRRHLCDFYEDINEHRLEYQLPFFDSALLEFIFSLPLDYRLNHRFYTDWFDVFPSDIKKVPWQTYPGHVQCPLPINENLSYQWQKRAISFKKKLKIFFLMGFLGLRIALSSPSLGPISRFKLFTASLIHLFGIRDYGYLIQAGEVYANCSSRLNKG